MKRGLVRVALAVGLGAMGVMRGPSLLGALAWTGAVLISAYGYGIALERLTRVRVSSTLTLISGFALLLVPSTLLARVGLLGAKVELAALVLGLACSLLPRNARDPGPHAPRWAMITSVVVGVVLVVIELGHDKPPISGGANHVFAIKRMWDLGGFGALHQQLGLGLVGEAYVSWASGAQVACMFEAGLCAALVAVVLAQHLGSRGGLGATAFVITVIPLALYPEISEQWSSALLATCMFFTLGPAIEERRVGWHTIVLAVALMALRTEFIVFAGPFVAAAAILPRAEVLSRRAIAASIFAWCVVLVPLQISLAVPPLHAVASLVAILAVIPVVALVLRLAGDYPWRSAFAVIWFAALSFLVAVLVHAIRKAQHLDAATVTVWFSLGVCCLASIERERIVAGASAFLLAMVFSVMSFTGYFEYDRYGMMLRHYHAVMMFRDQVLLGGMQWTHEDVRDLQALVPAGASIAFWGQSAALLDFHRNPIRDASWPTSTSSRRERNFLPAMLPPHLRGVQYVIVEDLESNSPEDPWDQGYVSATSAVDGQLDELARLGIARLYRVK